MIRTTFRARDAAKAIARFALAGQGNAPRPLAYVEALGMEPDEQRRKVAEFEAGQRLAAYAEREAAFAEIVSAFFGKLPLPGDEGPDQVSSIGVDAPRDADPSSPAPALTPATDPDGDSDAEIGPIARKRDDRRTLEEQLRAGRVLIHATLAAYDLADAARGAMQRVRQLAYAALRSDGSASAQLDKLANDLRTAAAAAGTEPPQILDQRSAAASRAAQKFCDEAIRRGAGADELHEIVRLSKEHDQLGGRVAVRLDRYIAAGLERWRKNCTSL